MSKLDSILGSKFQEHRQAILTRSFELGTHTFKVRVPTAGETEAMYERINNPDKEKIDALWKDKFAKLLKEKDDTQENVVYKEDDIIVEGKSLKESTENIYVAQERVVEYFKLLVPEEGQTWDGLEYSDIESSMPWAIQIELVQNIIDAISPNYKDIRTK
jgi:hypothetical protein